MSNKSEEFYNQAKAFNYYACLHVIIFGIIGNSITIVSLLQIVDWLKFKFSLSDRFYRGVSMTSAKTYMLAIAVFDTLFLMSHLIEDIIPYTSEDTAYQFINRSQFFCKFVLHLRNSTRIISCYLVVMFAWERYIIIVSPLKRLKLLSAHTTRKIIGLVVVCTVVATSYTLVISGLRDLEKYELSSRRNKDVLHECDTLRQYKTVYNYVIFIYVIVGIIAPIIFLVFFNLTIIKVLLTRKKRLFKKKFIHTNNKFNMATMPPSMSTSLPRSKESTSDKQDRKRESMVLFRQETISVNVPKMSKNFKGSDRVTYMLIMISLFFICLNLPYISTWLAFFVPFKADLLSLDQIHYRYSYVKLTETLHLLNFSIGIVFYMMSAQKSN